MGELTLILSGACSGKSSHALKLADEIGNGTMLPPHAASRLTINTIKMRWVFFIILNKNPLNDNSAQWQA